MVARASSAAIYMGRMVTYLNSSQHIIIQICVETWDPWGTQLDGHEQYMYIHKQHCWQARQASRQGLTHTATIQAQLGGGLGVCTGHAYSH
jgi:hypothetical protein